METVHTATIQDTHSEKEASAVKGLGLLVLLIVLELVSIAALVYGIILLVANEGDFLGVTLIVVSSLLICFVLPILFAGIRIIKPNEARVLTLFGKYVGTLRRDGIYWVNPFAVGAHIPQATEPAAAHTETAKGTINLSLEGSGAHAMGKRLSLKTMTLSTSQQKINDLMGNPIIISIIVIWRVVDTAKAVFNVDNYFEFLSVQSDSALRNIVRKYPYDSTDNVTGHEKSLRGSSQEIAENLRAEIQEKVAAAGLEISEARITHLAYAPEIAAAMLQRQQASAIVDARSLIVEGAVGMVQAALGKLSEQGIVELDEERKAAMVSNLLVVLCANKDAQPVVNSGTLY
jgi:regulator of protease activity HflC (stomatin/prohibitin superfamily)